MTQHSIPAVFMRGGSSKGVFFHARDLPADRAAQEAIEARPDLTARLAHAGRRCLARGQRHRLPHRAAADGWARLLAAALTPS